MQFVIKEAFSLKLDKPFVRVPSNKVSFVRVTSNKVSWSSTDSTKNSSTLILNADQINSLVYLLDNLYIKYFEIISKHSKGISMGSDCGPDLANPLLFAYEYQYLMDLINTDELSYIRLKFIFRYIDDLIILNDKGLFNTIFNDIYPNILDLNSKNTDNKSKNFLDMSINICRDKFEHRL